MTMAAQPSFEYLLSASSTSLESLQLSRLDQIAALKSQIHDAVEAWATAELDVRLTRLILETRLAVSEPQHRILAQLHSLGPTRCSPTQPNAHTLTDSCESDVINVPASLPPIDAHAPFVHARRRPSVSPPTAAHSPSNLRIAA